MIPSFARERGFIWRYVCEYARLASAGFNNDIVDMPVEKLSGGQKARLLMLVFFVPCPGNFVGR